MGNASSLWYGKKKRKLVILTFEDDYLISNTKNLI
jgi:hypothetical protein